MVTRLPTEQWNSDNDTRSENGARVLFASGAWLSCALARRCAYNPLWRVPPSGVCLLDLLASCALRGVSARLCARVAHDC